MYLFVGDFFEIYPCGHIYQWLLLLFSHLVMSNYLQPHGLQHAELHCSSLSPIVCSNSCPLNNHGNFFISIIVHILLTICCYCSVAQSCPTLWNPMDCSTPGFPEFCHLLELAQIHVHWLVMPYNHLICSPLLLLPSIFPRIRVFFPMSQLFTLCGQSTGASASVLLMNIQGLFPLGLTGLISLQSKGLSIVFSNTKVQKLQFFDAQPSLQSNSHSI